MVPLLNHVERMGESMRPLPADKEHGVVVPLLQSYVARNRGELCELKYFF